MTGGQASAVFGETLGRHLFLSHCGNEKSCERSHCLASPVIHSFGDPPFRGSKKTTLARPPPLNTYVSLHNFVETMVWKVYRIV